MSLRIEDVTLRLPGQPRPLVEHLSAEVADGEILTVTGPSGSGKSTLLDFIGGHLAPGVEASGRVFVAGRDVSGLPAEARHIGILFQDALLFPHLSVGENLAFALPAGTRGRAARQAAVEEALGRAGLQGYAGRDPASLSGGERARVALMRTLLSEPRALLLDEPFSRLDPDRRRDVRSFVFALARERRIPVLLVTHDSEDAVVAAGPVIAIGD